MKRSILLALFFLQPLLFNYAHAASTSINNPFAHGCLAEKLPGWTKRRVCNSDDDPSEIIIQQQQGGEETCRIPEIDYREIRIIPQNYDGAIFTAWVVQIVLSELLDVPTTTETSFPDKKCDFYDPDGRYDYGSVHDWDALELAKNLGDCRLANRSPDEENYQPCADFLAETFLTPQKKVHEGKIEAPQLNGVALDQTWFVTKFTLENDPTLHNYLGLQGISTYSMPIFSSNLFEPL